MALAVLATLVVACSPAPPQVHVHRFEAFATPVTLQATGVSAAALTSAGERLQADLASVENDWYAYGTGELAAVNAALARGRSVTLSPDLAALVRRALELHRATGGLFDPSVGDLVALWGFDRASTTAALEGPPAATAIEELLRQRGGMADLRLEGRRLSSTRPVRLDLNGLAKGTAVVRAVAILESAGISNALVDLGGSSMLALGTRGDRPWRVGIQHPRPGEAPGDNPSPPIVASVELQPGESVSTSGDYQRYLDVGGRRYGHVLDPRTGYPVTETAAATVITRDPELAEAASTALMVAGPRGMAALCRSLGIELALVIGTDGGLHPTPAMARRMGLDPAPAAP